MKRTIHLAPAVLCTLLLPASSYAGWDNATSACTRSAFKMHQSCTHEVHEEYRATLAACINLSDPADELACREEALSIRQEDRQGCRDQRSARREVCELLQENKYDPDPLTDPALEFVDPNAIGDSVMPNPYFSLVAGTTQVLRAGEDFEETIVVHVTEDVRQILGVDCRIVVDIVVLAEDDGEGGVDYEAIEVTDDYYAQAAVTSDVYYCGEIARNFEDGALADLDGSFEAGRDLAKSGILIKANPAAGQAHRQEWLLGEAEDTISYVGVNEVPTAEEGGENPNIAFSCSMNGGCVKTEEFIPTEPEAGEFKYYLANVGFVLGVGLEDDEITGERDELLCIGDSLDILADPSCGIADVDKLRAELCRLSRDTYCAN